MIVIIHPPAEVQDCFFFFDFQKVYTKAIIVQLLYNYMQENDML